MERRPSASPNKQWASHLDQKPNGKRHQMPFVWGSNDSERTTKCGTMDRDVAQKHLPSLSPSAEPICRQSHNVQWYLPSPLPFATLIYCSIASIVPTELSLRRFSLGGILPVLSPSFVPILIRHILALARHTNGVLRYLCILFMALYVGRWDRGEQVTRQRPPNSPPTINSTTSGGGLWEKCRQVGDPSP